jgi:hypothetical protein
VLPSSPLFVWVSVAAIAVTVVSLLAPAPRRPIPSGMCLVHIAAAAIVLSGAVLLGIAGYAFIAVVMTVAALIVGMPAFWVARAPNRHGDSEGDESDEDDDGGRGRGPDPRPSPHPPAPGGLDWQAFDRARAGWERDRVREPVAG